LADGRIERVLRDHTGPIRALAYSADGQRLASGGDDRTVRITNLAGKEEADQVIQTNKGVTGLALAPDGTRVVVSHDKDIAVLRDLAGGKAVPLRGAKAFGWWGPTVVAWSPNAKTIATGSEDGLWLWEADGKLRHHLLARQWAVSVAFSADSRHVLATSWSNPERAWVFDAQNGKQERMFTDQHFPSRGVFAPDGSQAATAGGIDNICEIFLWKTGNGSIVRRIAASSRLGGPNLQAGWSSDGNSVAWRKVDKPDTWKGGPTAFSMADLHYTAYVESAQFRGGVARRGKLSLKPLNATTVQVLEDGKHPADLKLPTGQTFQPEVVREQMVLVGKDRAALFSGAASCWVYDVHTGKLLHTLAHGNRPISAAGSPNGRYLVTLATDQVLRIWDVETGKRLLGLFVFGHDWIAWTSEGYYAASPGGEKLVGWVADNGMEQAPSFYPAQRFRKLLHRPDVIQLLLDRGSLDGALAAANAIRQKEGEPVAEGVARLEQLLPPQAALEIVDQKGLPKVKLKATATAAPRGQPVIALQLRVDGRPLPQGTGVLDLKDAQQKAETEWEVELPPGEHELKVLARCRDVTGISPAVSINAQAAASDRPTLYLIAAGINDYPEKSLHLTCAVGDAQGLAEAFPKCCAGKDNLFRQAKVTPLLNEKATRGAILEAFKAARAVPVQPGDLLVFSFAGHGVKQGKKFYLLTADADPMKLAETALSGDDLRAALKDLPCQVLLLLDACHSAAGVRAFIDEAARGLTDDECGVAVLCAAMGHEEAQEKNGHGLFTKAVLDALSRVERVPYNYRDGRQYVHHLGAFVLDEVQGASNDMQHPFLTLPYVTESFPLRQLPLQPVGDR
jgi:WD40 repeat protein